MKEVAASGYTARSRVALRLGRGRVALCDTCATSTSYARDAGAKQDFMPIF